MNLLDNFEDSVAVKDKPDKSGMYVPPKINLLENFNESTAEWPGPGPLVGHGRLGPPRETSITKLMFEGLVKGSPEDQNLRKKNIDHIMKVAPNLKREEVEKNYQHFLDLPQLRTKAGIEYQPPTLARRAVEFSEAFMKYTAPVLIPIGLATHPFKTVTGVLGFSALDHAIKPEVDKFVPSDASDNFRAMVELAELYIEFAVSGKIVEATPGGRNIAFTKEEAANLKFLESKRTRAQAETEVVPALDKEGRPTGQMETQSKFKTDLTPMELKELKTLKSKSQRPFNFVDPIKGILKEHFKQSAKAHNIPDVLTFTADKLNAIKQRLSHEEFNDFLFSVGITPAHDDAAGEGVDIRIPTEKLFESMVKNLAQEKDVSKADEIVEAIIIGPSGKEYTGIDHGEAIENAKAAGEDMSQIDRWRDGKFKLKDGRTVDREEAAKVSGLPVDKMESHLIPEQKPKRKSINLQNAIDRGSKFGVIKALGGFSVKEEQGELGSGEQRTLNLRRMFGVYRKGAPGADEVLAEAKELAPHLFPEESGSQLIDYFKNRIPGKEGEFKAFEPYEKERNEEYEREIQSLTQRAIEAGISPDTIRALIEGRIQEGQIASNKELSESAVPEELKEADPSFDFGANVEKEKQAQIPGTAPKLPEGGIKPTDKNLIQETGELFEPDKKYSIASVFYSALERAIDQKMPVSAPVSQVKGIIDSSGIPKDQLDWIDLDSFLKGKDKVSKEDLLNYIRQNDVRVEEVVHGQQDRVLTPEENSRLEELTKRNEKKPLGAIDDDESGSWNELLTLENIRDKSTSRDLMQKHDEFEKLAREAQRKGNQKLADKYWERTNHYTARHEEFELSSPGEGGLKDNTKFGQYQLPGGENYKELILTVKGVDYTDSHFPDEKGNIAWVRYNDRADVDAKKVLLMEELQSGVHQKGRKQGYGKRFKVGVREDENVWVVTRADGKFGDVGKDEAKTAEEAQAFADAHPERYKFNATEEGVPNAPFKKTWHELALKRMLRYAAENGYDKIAWTTGEQQADRYDLSKKIEKLQWRALSNGNIEMVAKPIESADVIDLPEKPLAQIDDVIGKEVADKIRKSILNGGNAGTLNPSDLKVGGEGMKGFYDQIIPSFLNKYTKKWGGRVGTTDIVDQAGEQPFARVHSLEITPSMKQSVLYEGQRYRIGQPKNQAEQFRIVEEGRKLWRQLGHKNSELVIESNLKGDRGEKALGYFLKYGLDRGVSKVDPASDWATYPHELTHEILGLAYKDTEKRAIFDEVQSFAGTVDDKASEEWVAEEAHKVKAFMDKGGTPEEYFRKEKYTKNLIGFFQRLLDDIKRWIGLSEDKQFMKNTAKFYQDLFSGARKEVTASDKETFTRYSKEKDPENQREILKSKPYYDKIKGLLTDRETPPNEAIPERFTDSAAQPLSSQVKSAGIAFKSGSQELIKAVNKVFNPATAAKVSAGEPAYAAVIKAIHTPDAEMIGFNNARSAIFDLNFQEIEKLFNRLPKKDLQNFNLVRGQAEDPVAMMLQDSANKEIEKSFRPGQLENLISTVKDVSDYVYKYLKDNGVELNYFKDYFYGAYKDPNRAKQFVEYWQSTDRFQKEKVFPTIADAQAFGLELRDPNPVTNLRSEMRAASLKVGLRHLRETMEKEGHNYTEKMESLTPEQKRLWKKVNEDTFEGLRFDPDYADFVNSLLSTNKISSNYWLSGLRKVTYLGQQIKFFGSLFHLRNVTKAAVSDETMGIFNKEGYKNIIKSFKAIDQAMPEYKEYVNLGGGHKYSIESQAQVSLLKNIEKITGGSWLGKAVEGSKWIPASPKMIEWMFEDYIPSIKFNRYLKEIEVQKDRLGRQLTDAEKINIIRTNQNFYGEMNERLFGRSGTVTTALRFVFLAPGYAEGNFRVLFQSIGDTKKLASRKYLELSSPAKALEMKKNKSGVYEYTEQGQRNAQFIASSLFTTLAMATIGTMALTGQAPPAPKTARDFRDLFKIKTELKDGNGDDVFIDMMGYDNDFYAVYGNLLTGKGGDIPGALGKRLSGMTSGMFRTMNDITTILNGGMVYDFRGLPIYYQTDDLPEKVGKFIEYESTQAGAISFQSLLDAQRRGVSLPAATAGSIIGLRATTSEEVKATKKARTDIFTLEDAKRGKNLDLNKLYKENPDRAMDEAKKFNESQMKKVIQILKKVGITEPPPKKFFEQFIIKNLKGAGPVEEGTTIETLYKYKKRKKIKVETPEEKSALDQFVKENFNQ